ncbi:MAG: citrate/2-methylcitrate synthase [Clostridia bacterium]|nr:citrate/2-methylcitrate synthase [Clostridia bacterium]
MAYRHDQEIDHLYSTILETYSIPSENYSKFEVKRGLRNLDGSGVLAGLTKVSEVQGYIISQDEKVPVDGTLAYRGYDIGDLVENCNVGGRYRFEQVCFLLLEGRLPSSQDEFDEFLEFLNESSTLPDSFTEDMILKQPSKDIMNKLARSVLTLYSYDEDPDNCEIRNILRQSVQLIAQMPILGAYAYRAKRHYFDGSSLILHSPKREFSIAENLLRMLRSNKTFDPQEAEILDLALMLHAEHGGGNNSTFTCRVLSSSGTDTYGAIAAAISALKGPRHGGANAKVIQMFDHIKANVNEWTDEQEVYDFLTKIVRKEAFDHSGLIYGMGHAVYTSSDPRAVILKEKARILAEKTGNLEEFNLYELVERLGKEVLKNEKDPTKVVCANVDFYSGFVYRMLNIPPEMFTPIFAMARVAGWCAHRIEEVISGGRIIRPAYKAICKGGSKKVNEDK